jgi:large subunit ribosomal protein L5
MKKTHLSEVYEKEIVPTIMSEFGLVNPNAVPKLIKIVLNSGVGEAVKSKERMAEIVKDLGIIAGQKPQVRKAKVSVASFSVRQGMDVGLKVTLRGGAMYNFLEKVTAIVFPRFRDFRGLPLKSFDENGNYTMAFTEHTLFPDIDVTKVSKPFGFEMTFVLTSKNKDIKKRILELLGLPFEKKIN